MGRGLEEGDTAGRPITRVVEARLYRPCRVVADAADRHRGARHRAHARNLLSHEGNLPRQGQRPAAARDAISSLEVMERIAGDALQAARPG
jgi:hypothetical protein